MKNKAVNKRIRSMIGAAVLGLALTAGTAGAEEAQTEKSTATEVGQAAGAEESETESETEAEPVVVIETVDFPKVDGRSLLVENAADQKLAQLFVKKSVDEEWHDKPVDVNAELEAGIYDLKAVFEDGTVLVYPNLSLSDMDTLTLLADAETSYIIYHDITDDTEVNTKEYAYTAFAEPQVLYMKDRLNVREQPNAQSDIIDVIALGDETKVYGEAAGWYLVKCEEKYGYISGKYVTESKEEAQQMVEAEEAARARIAAEAAAAAQAQAQAAAQAAPSGGSGKKEVSREKVPSCNDANHGTIYITYSDGSVATQEY